MTNARAESFIFMCFALRTHFAFFSTFTVMETKWSDNSTEPHEILLAASKDNLNEDDDLPLAPWY